MLTTGPANLIREEVQQQTVLKPKLRLLAEFNNNRFADPKVKLNGTIFDETMDADSIVEINRPQDEIRYAIAGYAKCTSKESNSPRYRVSGPDIRYEYLRSEAIGAANNNAFDVQVTHESAWANVLYAKFNTHGGTVRPNSVEVYYRRQFDWHSVGTFVPNSAGEVILYRQATNNWSTAKHYGNPLNIVAGIKIVVRSAKPTGRVELVELATKFVTDMSDDVINFDLSYSKDEPSIQQPLGVGQAGTLDITLDDTSNTFAQSIPGQYRKYLERDAKFMLSLGYMVGTETWYVDQPEYWSDAWQFNSEEGSVTVSCTDRSRWIQNATVGDVIYEDCPAPFVVRELLESSGISGIDFRRAPEDGPERLPWVWYRDGESLWDSISVVAKAVNGSFYYNSAGDLVWVSKNLDYEQEAPVYKFSSDQEGEQVPNLFAFSQQFEEVFNSVKVSYERLDPNENAFGDPTRQSLWDAPTPLSLRSGDLRYPISTTLPGVNVTINEEEMDVWPFEGKFQIEGEVFSYRGKYAANGTTIVYSADDTLGSGPFSGRFANVERAIDGTIPDVHIFGNSGATTQFRANKASPYPLPVVTKGVKDGAWNVKHQATRSSYDGYAPYWYYVANTRGVDIDSYEVYGTEIIFPSSGQGRGEGIAGMLLHQQVAGAPAGYYFELLTNDYVLNRRNSSVGNVRCYRNNGSANIGKPGLDQDPEGIGLRGYFTPIEYDTPYRLEVHVGKNMNDDQTFYVYLNGQFITKFTDTTFESGLWGTFVRGDTEASFEYFYAYENDADHRYITDEQYLATYVAQKRLYDRIIGDYTFAGPELASAGRVGKYRWFFEEYQPVVHERREFDVSYSVAPAFNYVLYNSNPSGVVLHTVNYTPFSAKFILDNASRKNEFVSGTDAAGNQYAMQLFGQPMARLEAKDVTVKDKTSIREHGLNELEYSNPWVQTEEQALEQGEFIKRRWADPLDVATAEVQYDPTLELGDLVEIEHFERRIYSKYYFITAINVGWDNGYTCSLTLRRNHLYYY